MKCDWHYDDFMLVGLVLRELYFQEYVHVTCLRYRSSFVWKHTSNNNQMHDARGKTGQTEWITERFYWLKKKMRKLPKPQVEVSILDPLFKQNSPKSFLM